MNPVFWLLVILGAVLLWFLLSFAYKGIGYVASRLFNEAVKEIEDDTGKNEELDEQKENVNG